MIGLFLIIKIACLENLCKSPLEFCVDSFQDKFNLNLKKNVLE